MAIDVFGHRVYNDIRPMVQGVLDVWTEKGIVYHDHDSVLMSNRGNRPDVHQAQCRIAGAFDPDQFRLLRPYELRDVKLNAR